MAGLSKFQHIMSAHYNYTLSDSHQIVLNAVRYADYIVSTLFIWCILKTLQLLYTKISYASPFKQEKQIIRNRYQQIMDGKTPSRPPPSYVECIKCGEEMEKKAEAMVSCCDRFIHENCASTDCIRPYCGKSWVLMNFVPV